MSASQAVLVHLQQLPVIYHSAQLVLPRGIRGRKQPQTVGPCFPQYSHGLHVCLGVAIKIPIVCVVLEGGPGTLHVSTSCCAPWGSGLAVEERLVDAFTKIWCHQ